MSVDTLDDVALVCSVACGFCNADFSQWTSDRWGGTFDCANKHGVLPMVTDCCTEHGAQAGGDVKLWLYSTEVLRRKLELNTSVVKRLGKLLASANIDMLLLKGLSLNLYWPHYNWRVSSDVDFYLFGRWREADELMRKSGILQVRDFPHHHTMASLNGVLLENHYDFFDTSNHRSNRVLDAAMKRMVSNDGYYRPLTELGDNVFAMSPTMSALFLMRHMSAHFASETLTLRMLLDWALFLRREKDNVDWNSTIDLYRKGGLIPFAEIVSGLVSRKLNDDIAFPVDICDDATAERVWRSMATAPEQNRYREGSLRYVLYEAHVFWDNRWKYRIAFPRESYLLLLLKYLVAHLVNVVKR